MIPRFHNALTGLLEDFRPPAAPLVSFVWRPGAEQVPDSLEAFRERVFVSCLLESLAYLGYSLEEEPEPLEKSPELYCGPNPPPPGVLCWLKPASAQRRGGGRLMVQELAARGFELPELRLLCLKTHYRQPLELSWVELDAARSELARLKAAAKRLQGGYSTLAPSPAGLAGYKKRFRDALASDLNVPEALASLWDALRPGALSPGSQLAALREAEPVLGLPLAAGTASAG